MNSGSAQRAGPRVKRDAQERWLLCSKVNFFLAAGSAGELLGSSTSFIPHMQMQMLASKPNGLT